MKLILIISIIHLIVGCSNGPDKSRDIEHNSRSNGTKAMAGKDTSNVFDSSKNEISDKTTTITVSYAAIACNCAQWFETKYQGVKFLEGVERLYIEPASKELTNASDLWDGEHLPLILKITGRFSKEKGLPITYHIKGEPEKARIFWYDKIIVISPFSDERH